MGLSYENRTWRYEDNSQLKRRGSNWGDCLFRERNWRFDIYLPGGSGGDGGDKGRGRAGEEANWKRLLLDAEPFQACLLASKVIVFRLRSQVICYVVG